MPRLKNLDREVKTRSGNVRTITDFLNNEYRQFSQYVISTRCCPSIFDGCKVGARKLLHAAFHGGLKNGEDKKVPTLVGDCYVHTLYQHGDSSLVGTIITLGAFFEDNLNPLEIIGQGGSLRAPNAVAAPRYLKCKLSKYAKLYKIDEDLLEYVFDEGEYLEPTHYLPIIPLILTARNEGMAPGYKFSSFSYNPIDIIDACSEVIKGKEIKTVIRPYVRGIKSKNFVWDGELSRWINNGEWTFDEKHDTLLISDLPYDISYDKFEKKLNKLLDDGTIKIWKDFSQDDAIDYRIGFQKGALSKYLNSGKKDNLVKMFMLQSTVPDDLLYVLDENNKVHHFLNKEDLITYFVKLRLQTYAKRKDRLVDIKNKQLSENNNLCKFIDLIISGKLKINNRPVADVKKDLDSYELPHSLLSIPLSKLTKEERDALVKKNQVLQDELKYIQETSIDKMYLNDLAELRKDLIKDFDK